jgi:Glycosyltransferase family 87/WD40-like Beta Propeller Repeat
MPRSISQVSKATVSADKKSSGLSPLQALDSSRNSQARPRKSRWYAWAERLLLVALVTGFAIKGFVPAWRHLNSDFPNYYLVARLYRAGYPLERVYDWTWLQRQKDHQGIDQRLVSFIPSTLPSALAVAPWISLPPLEAKRRWLVVNLALLLATAFLLVSMTKLGWERVVLLIFLAFIPLRDNFVFGQMHVLVLLLLTLAAWLFFKEFSFLSGISLAIAAALKIYPAFFLIYFLWKKQWRAAAGLIVGLLAVAGISLYLFGVDACILYARHVLPAGLRGETLDPYNPAWNSWTALVRRLFIAEPELNPAPVAHLPWLYALLQPLIHASIFVLFMWAIGPKRLDIERTKIEWATFIFLLLFLSSQPGSYHFVALILSTVLIADYLLTHNHAIHLGAMLAIYALIGVPIIRFPWAAPNGWQNLLFFPRLALMTAFGGLLLWILISKSPQARLARPGRRNALVAASAVIVLTAVGFISTERHLRGQFDNYKDRIASTPGGLLATEPAPYQAGILFTTMTPTGYTVRRLQNGIPIDLPKTGGDYFHAAAPGGPGAAWVEQSVRGSSRIVRFALGLAGQEGIASTEEENAQEPSVSHDGQFLAFLRPVRGRNSLWVRRIGTALSDREAGHAGEAYEIASEAYDVHEAAFLLDHRLIFSSRTNGRFRLYRANQAGSIELLNTPDCSARYPAISPDGQWLAFSCAQGGATQIHVTDLEGNRESKLTFGDCNSVTPAWTADSKSLIYATDCGRGLGLTALAQVSVFTKNTSVVPP